VGAPFYYEIAATNTPTSYAATGLPPGVSLNTTTGVISGVPTTAGLYSVFVTMTNAGGNNTATISINVGGATTVAATSRLLNLSSNATVSSGLPLTDGFIITGPGSQTVLLRGIGPGLTAYLNPNNANGTPLATPGLALYNAAGNQILSAGSWDGSSTLMQIFNQVGAFPLTVGSTDAAVVTTLAPGNYTLIISSADGSAGTALAEVYAADPSPLTVPQRLGNLSARGTVGTGEPLTGGFVVGGTASKQLLLRGVGPALGSFGITNSIPTPILTIYNSAGAVVATNSSWGTQSNGTTAASIAAAAASAGAFPLPAGSADAALLLTLAPGTYTGQVTDAGGNTGPALFEVYSLSP
jgi:putative Ig domain-containing protein